MLLMTYLYIIAKKLYEKQPTLLTAITFIAEHYLQVLLLSTKETPIHLTFDKRDYKLFLRCLRKSLLFCDFCWEFHHSKSVSRKILTMIMLIIEIYTYSLDRKENMTFPIFFFIFLIFRNSLCQFPFFHQATLLHFFVLAKYFKSSFLVTRTTVESNSPSKMRDSGIISSSSTIIALCNKKFKLIYMYLGRENFCLTWNKLLILSIYFRAESQLLHIIGKWRCLNFSW